MSSSRFDIVTIGGGMAASAFGAAMAKNGASVLILEKETKFRDRVRGEYLVPWGVAEARELGLHEALMQSGAIEVPIVDMGFGPRPLIETTPQRLASLTFHHPEMQETLLAQAENSGAEVRRGVTATAIETGPNPAVVASNGREEKIHARLVVVADGRGSTARKWAGFSAKTDMYPFHFAGVLLEGASISSDLSWLVFNPEFGLIGGIVPQSKNRCRAYLGYPADGAFTLQGTDKVEKFLAESRRVAPIFADCYAPAKSIGPLAAFDAGYMWVDRPYRDGVALIGEAAAVSDPSFGQGMSLSLRDARVLRDALVDDSDWDRAGRRYAEQHDKYFQTTHTVCRWFRSMFQEQGAAADARRQKAMSGITADMTRVPDHLFSGPELPMDETVRARFFGDD
ncbi:MAG TPA: NAD(P)/FAD-dependent oxidoreductase [Candidatus Acidoferrum sp.]|jgi:2-polyprenyl-6-methoxyphenol hydroxylase-like FAD-dependent oxidoreductase